MTAGDRFDWCQACGGLFPAGMAHACMPGGRRFQNYYAPNPVGQRPDGAYVTPLLTEQRVREIIREELERARSPLPSEGEMRKEMEE